MTVRRSSLASKKTLAFVVAVALVLTATAAGAWVCRTRIYPWKLSRIQRGFENISSARIFAYGGYPDITLEQIWAEVEVRGGTLRLRDFGSDSFQAGGGFVVQRVGPWWPH
jgi:hypothetical protein